MSKFLAIVFLWLSLAATATGAAAPETKEFKVGTAIGGITPTSQELRSEAYFMGGYGFCKDRGPAEKVHDQLTVRTICIEVDSPLCLVVIDSLGVPGPLADQIRQAAALKSGVPANNIIVSATHTHAAPDLLGLWGGSPASYRARLIDEIAATVSSAFRGRVSANLSFAVGKGHAHNRRGWGFTDDELGLLLIQDPATSINIGAVVFFAAHPVVTPMANKELSSDFVHYLREDLSRELNAPVLYFNGAIGDVNPHAERSDAFWLSTEQYGSELAMSAAALMEELTPLEPSLTMHHEKVRFPVENTTLNIAGLLGLVEGNTEGPPWNRSVESDLYLIQIGSQLNMLTLPGEATTRLGLEIKKRLPDGYSVIVGQANDSLGYLIPVDEWQTGRNGDYEESVSLGKSAAPLILQGLQNLLTR